MGAVKEAGYRTSLLFMLLIASPLDGQLKRLRRTTWASHVECMSERKLHTKTCTKINTYEKYAYMG
jgi:hypothetical protein